MKRTSLCLCLLVVAAAAQAAGTGDEAFPIQLEAGSLEIDKKSGQSVYRGNVILSRGPVTINADVMTVFTTAEQVERIVATGKPVSFVQLPGDGRKSIRGQANTIEYSAADNVVVLTENAELWQDQDRFIGEIIRYDMEQELVTAGKAEADGTRVKVVIHPKKEKRESAPAAPAQ